MSERVQRGVPTGGQFATHRKSESDVSLPEPTIEDLFPDPHDADEAASFNFDWGYIDFDDYNGYTAYDPDAPRLLRTTASSVQVGEEVHVPGTTSVYRPVAKVAQYVGEARDGSVAIWTEGQDPAVDPPLIESHCEDLIDVRRSSPAPDLSIPQQFNRELSRRVYAQTAYYASVADERHDVERIAEQAVEPNLRMLIHEASDPHHGAEVPTVTVDETWCCCDVMPVRYCPIHGEHARA